MEIFSIGDKVRVPELVGGVEHIVNLYQTKDGWVVVSDKGSGLYPHHISLKESKKYQ